MTILRVSILTPVRNGAAYLAETVESVARQSIACEHIVIDDGSTDATPDIAASFGDRIRYVRQEPRGAAAAINLGLGLARAPYVAILDADDLMTDDRLAAQCALLDSGIDLAFGRFSEFASGSAAEQGRWTVRSEPQADYITGAAMFRIEIATRIGGFNEALVLGWFIDMVMRAREDGVREALSDDLVLLRRVHGDNTTIVSRDRQNDYLSVARAAIARRRG